MGSLVVDGTTVVGSNYPTLSAALSYIGGLGVQSEDWFIEIQTNTTETSVNVFLTNNDLYIYSNSTKYTLNFGTNQFFLDLPISGSVYVENLEIIAGTFQISSSNVHTSVKKCILEKTTNGQIQIGGSNTGTTTDVYNNVFKSINGFVIYGAATSSEALTIISNTYSMTDENARVIISGSQMVFENNLLINQHASGKLISVQGSPASTDFKNNIYSSASETDAYRIGANFYSSFAAFSTAIGGDANSSYVADYTTIVNNASGGDLTLVADTSPAIDAGFSSPEITDDLLGTARPQGSAFDIGAYEFQAEQGGGSPLLCWQLTGQYENGRAFQLNGPNKFPGLDNLKLPKLSNVTVIEDGKVII